MTRTDRPTAGTPLAEVSLPGLEPDNLLAFLALLGVLRAISDEAGPETSARAWWEGTPMACRLSLAAPADPDSLASRLHAGLRRLARDVNFGGVKDVSFTPSEFRALALAARGTGMAPLVSALASDGAVQTKGRESFVIPTPLCLMFGQGHQHFLERIDRVESRAASQPEDEAIRELKAALFERWSYDNRDAPSFRWDPIEDRRYALQGGDPSEQRNKVGTVPGANRLAVAGLGLLTSVPTITGLATLSASGRRSDRSFCWPVPAEPTSLAGYRALLGHPWIADRAQSGRLRPYGVIAVARARRRQVDKYFYVERAELQYL